MAKMSRKLRKVVFENAINKLYGNRFIIERQEFESAMENIVLQMTQRTAKQNGVEYEALTTIYKPYIETQNFFDFRTNLGSFSGELDCIFYNENSHVLEFEGARFELIQIFRERHIYQFSTENHYPYASDQCFDETERKEIVAAFKKYAGFMNEVIASACAIRDVINSASTTQQLIDTSPELGKLLPEGEVCVALVPVETVKKVSALFAATQGF
jgi:hypothetical protein